MRIAFASSNGTAIDQHFGAAERFYLWEIGPDRAEAVGHVMPGADGEDGEDKIVARANALAGCTMVYTTQIGGPAAAKLVGRRIHPSKVVTGTQIADVICKLQNVLRSKPPPWLRKAAGLAPPEVEGEEELGE